MVQWTYQRQNQSQASDNKVDNSGNVYFEDGDGTLKSVDSTGTLRWTATDINGDGSSIRDFAPLPDGSEVIVNFYNDTWYFLDGSTGNVNSSTADTLGIADGAGMVSVGNTREVYVGAFGDDALYHYNADTDSPIKSVIPPNGAFSTPSTEIPYNSSQVFIADDSGYVYDLDASDFSVNDSLQIETFGMAVEDADRDGSYLVAAGFDLGASEGVYHGVDNSTTLTDDWRDTDNGAYATTYDDVEGKAIRRNQAQDKLLKIDNAGEISDEFSDGGSDYSDAYVNEDFDDTLVYANRGFGEVVQVADSEFTSVGPEAITATQVETPATMTTPTLIENFVEQATQVSTAGTMNTTVADTIPVFDVTATQVEGLATVNTVETVSPDPFWKIYTADGSQYTTDIRLDGGPPQFRVGTEFSRVFTFNREGHTAVYNELRSKYTRNLTDTTVQLVNTINGRPHFTQNINPISDADSYLWRVKDVPVTRDWWVVVTDISDVTRHAGPSEALEVTMVPIAPFSAGDRETITTEYEV